MLLKICGMISFNVFSGWNNVYITFKILKTLQEKLKRSNNIHVIIALDTENTPFITKKI